MTPFQLVKPVAIRSSVEYRCRGCAVFPPLLSFLLSYGSLWQTHIHELVEQWMVGWEAMGWVKPTSFHCVIELLGVCVSEGKRDLASEAVWRERERREREGGRESWRCMCESQCVWWDRPSTNLTYAIIFISLTLISGN